jgi:hypothetical protein
MFNAKSSPGTDPAGGVFRAPLFRRRASRYDFGVIVLNQEDFSRMTRRMLVVAVLLAAVCGLVAAQDLESTLSLLKGAEGQKNYAEIKRLSLECIEQGRKDFQAAGDDKERAEFAKSVQEYGEYAMVNAAGQAPAATKVDLISAVEKASPKSKYLESAYGVYFQALRDTGASAKIPDIADKAAANFPDSAELLATVLTDAAGRNQPDKVLSTSTKLLAAISKATKPKEVSDADWEKRRTAMLGPAYYYSGVVQYSKAQYVQADKSLRSALPLVKGIDSMYGQALLLLGGANFNIGKATNSKAKVQEAANFCSQASKVSFPQSQEAWRQSQLMTTEAAKMR